MNIILSIITLSDHIFGFCDDIEISLEANPSSYDSKRFKNFNRAGVNRLSIGVQSLNNKYLEFLGRLHKIEDIEISLKDASNTYENISVDFMYAFHGQNLNDWSNELKSFLNELLSPLLVTCATNLSE